MMKINKFFKTFLKFSFAAAIVLSSASLCFAEDAAPANPDVPTKVLLTKNSEEYKALKKKTDQSKSAWKSSYNQIPLELRNKIVAQVREDNGNINYQEGGFRDAFGGNSFSTDEIQDYTAAAQKVLGQELANAAAKSKSGSVDSCETPECKKLKDQLNNLVEAQEEYGKNAANYRAAKDFVEQTDVYYDCKEIDGKTNCNVVNANGDVVGGVSKECASIAARAGQFNKCIFCPLFLALFNTSQTLGTKASTAFGQGFANLLAIGMALFIAYETLKMVGSFTQQDTRKFLNTVFIQFFKMFIAYYLLTHMTEFYNLIVSPLIIAGFDFGTAMMTTSAGENSAGASSGVISTAVYGKINGFVNSVQQQIAQIIALGGFLWCYAFEEGKEDLLPNFIMMLSGGVFFIVGWMIMLSFSFLLIDGMIQLGVFTALAPFIIASWPFKLTKSYTMKGWGILLGCVLTFAMGGMMLSIVTELIAAGISGQNSSFQDIVSKANNPDTKVEEFNAMLDLSGTAFLVTIACAIIAFRLSGKISELVNKFGGDAGPGIGSDMGKQANHAAMRTAKTLGKAAGGAASAAYDGSKLQKGVNKVAAAAKHPIRSLRNYANKGKGEEGGSGGGAGGTASVGGAPEEANRQQTANNGENQTQQQSQQTQSGGSTGDSGGGSAGSSGGGSSAGGSGGGSASAGSIETTKHPNLAMRNQTEGSMGKSTNTKGK